MKEKLWKNLKGKDEKLLQFIWDKFYDYGEIISLDEVEELVGTYSDHDINDVARIYDIMITDYKNGILDID